MTHICCITALFLTGGSDTLLFSLYSRLREKGHDVTIYAMLPSTQYGSMKKKFEETGITVKNPHQFWKLLFLGMGLITFFPIGLIIPFIEFFNIHKIREQYLMLYRYIEKFFVYGGYENILFIRFFIDHKKYRYDVVSGYHAITLPLLHRIHTWFQIPIYYTEISSPKWRKKSIDSKYIEKYINSIDEIFVPSTLIGDELVTYNGLKQKYTVIPFFLDLPQHMFIPPERAAKTFGVIARLSQEKNQDVLIKVLKKVSEKNNHALLILVGNGPFKEKLHDLARSLGVLDKIVFIPKFERIDQVIDTIDIFTLLSDVEGMPLTLIEALYFGKPIIATSVGSIPDMVRENDNGYFVNKDDINAIAEKIAIIMENPGLYRDMATISRTIYDNNFNPELLFYKHLPYYEI